jgi:hypothetical protein
VGVTLEQRDVEQVVIVDMSHATGSSPGITRLLQRTARLMSRRGVPFTIDLSGRSDKPAACAS